MTTSEESWEQPAMDYQPLELLAIMGQLPLEQLSLEKDLQRHLDFYRLLFFSA